MKNLKDEFYFRLYSDCIMVKGHSRSLIIDLTREVYQLIPNSLSDVITEFKNKKISEVYNAFGNENKPLLDSYFQFLETNEFIQYLNPEDLYRFPEIDLTWEYPADVSNAIIDVDENSTFNFKKIFTELEKLGCRDIQIRFYRIKSIEFINKILNYLNTTRVKSMELFIKYSQFTNIIDYNKLMQENLRIKNLVIHSSPMNEVSNLSDSRNIAYIKSVIDSAKCCGNIGFNYFGFNIKLVSESQKHNTCLNRKMSIDSDGNIKNCPSMKENYGNIKNTLLAEAIDKPNFKKYWNINKDSINVCKDCEFRHICTDCRAYIEDPEDIYSKPLKCGYNPYTNEWKEWSTNPLKEKAIEFYNMQAILNI